MGISDVTTSFGLPTLYRVILPGLVGSILYGFIILPFMGITTHFDIFQETFVLILSSIILGSIISSISFYIYQFYEGLNFWPNRFYSCLYDRMCKNFEDKCKERDKIYEDIFSIKNNTEDADMQIKKLEDEIENIQNKIRESDSWTCWDFIGRSEILGKKRKSISDYNEKKHQWQNNKILLQLKLSKISYRIYESPYDLLKRRRYPQRPTRLGNVLADYEGYPSLQYGMKMMIFLPHIWFIIPQEVKDDIDLKGAIADLFVYTSFIFLTYPFIGGVFLALRIFDYLSNIMHTGNLGYNNISFIIIFCAELLVFFILSYLSYIISIKILIDYGNYMKAIFDIYRFDLADKLKINQIKGVIMSPIPSDDEFKCWREYGDFLMK